MTIGNDDDVLERLAGLARAVPDETHRASVRARCHAALARADRRRPALPPPASARGLPEVAAIGALALAYLAVIVHDAIRMLGPS